MDKYGKLLRAAAESDEAFSRTLREVLSGLDITVKDLAERAGVSSSTLYKIANEERSPSLSVLRKVLAAVRESEGTVRGNFIAVIAARHVLDEIVERSVNIGGKDVRTREYPAVTVEDAIVASVKAERDGAISIVCAPIVSSTIERIVDVPIATIHPRDSVTEAIRLAAKKSGI